MMSVLCSRKQMEIMFSKGAPESILSRCNNILCNDDGSTVPLSAHIRAQLEVKFNRLGLFAFFDGCIFSASLVLVWVGYFDADGSDRKLVFLEVFLKVWIQLIWNRNDICGGYKCGFFCCAGIVALIWCLCIYICSSLILSTYFNYQRTIDLCFGFVDLIQSAVNEPIIKVAHFTNSSFNNVLRL